MKKWLQVRIEEDEYRKLKIAAIEEGTSVSVLVRGWISKHLGLGAEIGCSGRVGAGPVITQKHGRPL